VCRRRPRRPRRRRRRRRRRVVRHLIVLFHWKIA